MEISHVIKAPLQSPNLNGIGNLWALLGNNIKISRIQSEESFARRTEEYLGKNNRKLVNSMEKRLNVSISNKGYHTKYLINWKFQNLCFTTKIFTSESNQLQNLRKTIYFVFYSVIKRLSVTQQAVFKCLRKIGTIQKIGTRISFAMNESKMEKCKNTCEISLTLYETTSFFTGIVARNEKWIFWKSQAK